MEPSVPISELSLYRINQRIEVKVLKKWIDFKQFAGSVLNFIFVDIYNGRVRAQVTDEHPEFQYFEQTIHEGEFKVISGFQYAIASSSMRLYHKSGIVYFTENTELEDTYSDQDMEHWMNFSDFGDIKSGGYNMKYPVDLVGHLDKIGQIRLTTDHSFKLTSDKKISIINFSLKDSAGNILECVAHGDLAEHLNKKWYFHGLPTSILTLSHWRVFKDEASGEYKIKDAGGMSRFEVDPKYKEVDALRKEMFGDASTGAHGVGQDMDESDSTGDDQDDDDDNSSDEEVIVLSP